MKVQINFVTIANGIEKYYQVAYTAMDDSTLHRELKPLQMINNNYEKILLTMDYDIVPNHDGIKQINVLDWLLEEQKNSSQVTEVFYLAGAGLAFRSQTSCLLPTGRFRSLTHTSCVLFLPLGRRSLHFKSCQMLFKTKKTPVR